MPFTAEEIADVSNKSLETFLDRGKVWKQDLQNKPMLDALNRRAGKFIGGKDLSVSFLVGSGYGGGSLQGYSGDDQVRYYNPTGSRRARYFAKEHHIGLVVTLTELKYDGIDVVENGADQETREMAGREAQALANIFDEKNEKLAADYTFDLDRKLHSDGSADPKSIAGIASLIVDNPTVGTVGGIPRSLAWWRNDAATAANAAAGGQGAITVNAAGGGALIEFMDKARRRRSKYAQGSTNVRYFCGSDFLDGYKKELRANGTYTNTGWAGARPDGSMQDPSHAGLPLEWDPTMDDIGLSKRCYALDLSNTGIRLLYLDGNRMKRHNPARPYDRYVMYQGITMTGLLGAKQLSTSGVYDIA